jgi:acyl-coenzyme A thioesterase PaaI-like protein
MHVTDLPINQALGMQLTAQGSTHLLDLPESPLLKNHVGTIHASVQFALAEACSGEFLLTSLGDGQGHVFAVLRTSEVKFRKPAHGQLRASARVAGNPIERFLDELNSRGRVLIPVEVEVSDAKDVVTMTGQFTWFLQRQTTAA